MKKVIAVLITVAFCLAVATIISSKFTAKRLIFLENIEALAEEEVRGMIECHESGDIYCPIDPDTYYKMVFYYQ